MASQRAVPPGFPRTPDAGSVSGAQPKLLVRKVGEQYLTSFTDDELQSRFDMCDDLLIQLLPYCRRKAAEHPEWSSEQLLLRVAHSLRSKGWDLTEAEVKWLIEQLEAVLRQPG